MSAQTATEPGYQNGYILVEDAPPSEAACVFYEVPKAIARRIQPPGDPRTFVECLKALLGPDPDKR